jgi:hypothetical protein
MDHCYSYGLFGLKERYETDEIIAAGGAWSLKLEYAGGNTRTSFGDNAGPFTEFNDCATAFYDLCGNGVVGFVPRSYYSPPDVSVSIRYEYRNQKFTNSVIGLARVNYKWNKFESLDNVIPNSWSTMNIK